MAFDIVVNSGELDRGIFVPFRASYIEPNLINKFSRSSFLSSFGTNQNDFLEFSVYDDAQNLISWEPVQDYILAQDGQILIDTASDINEADLNEGKNYILQYNFFRKVLGSPAGFNLYIEEISPSRTEVRVFPVLVGNESVDSQLVSEFTSLFSNEFESYTQDEITTAFNFVINFGNNLYNHIINWQSNQTDQGVVNSVVLKLAQPLNDNVTVGDEFWINQELSRPYYDRFSFQELPDQPTGQVMRGPNFSVPVFSDSRNDTGFQTWDTLIKSTEDFTTTQRLIHEYVQNDKERVQLNIDFNNFENFVHFSSAKERIENFRYKLSLIERYQREIETVQKTSKTYRKRKADPDVNDNQIYQNSVLTENKERISDIIQGFDDYERWLYEADPQFEQNTFPKDQYGKLAPLDTDEAEEWFSVMLEKAERYDEKNNDRLANNIPAFIKEDPDNGQFLIFIEMVGHFFDLMWVYIKHFQYKSDRTEDITDAESLSKDLSKFVAKSFGFELYNGFDVQDLVDYGFRNQENGQIYYVFSPLTGDKIQYGENDTAIEFTVFPEYGSEGTGFDIEDQFLSGQDVQKQIWRRILNSIPHIAKNKGNRRAISALLTSYGIPNSALTIKEYGGTKINHIPTLYEFEDLTHSLNFYGDNYLETPWIDNSATYIPTPTTWQDVTDPLGSIPKSVQIRFRTEYLPDFPITLFEVEDSVRVTLEPVPGQEKPYGMVRIFGQDESGNTFEGSLAETDPIPLFENDWYTFEIHLDDETDSFDYRIQKKSRFGNLMHQRSGSITGLSYMAAKQWTNASKGFIGGDVTNSPFDSKDKLANGFVGEIDNIKYWNDQLPDEQFDEHTLAPYKYDWKNENLLTDDSLLYSNSVRINRKLLLNIDFTDTDNLYWDNSIKNEAPILSFVDNQNTNVQARGYNDEVDSVEDYPFQFVRYYRKNFVLSIKSGAQALYNDKIRLEDSNLVGNLSANRKNEVGSLDNITKDSPKLGIFFSPQKQINEDIIGSIGLDNINQLLGDPREKFKEEYEDLNALNRKYWLKYPKPYDFQEFIQYVSEFNKAFFKQVRNLVPARAQLKDGLLLEPHILERHKFKTNSATITEESKQADIQLESDRWLEESQYLEPIDVDININEKLNVTAAENTFREIIPFRLFPERRVSRTFDYDCDNTFTAESLVDDDNPTGTTTCCDALFYGRIPFTEFNITFIDPIQDPENVFHREYFFFSGPFSLYGPVDQIPQDNQSDVAVYNQCGTFYSDGKDDTDFTNTVVDIFGVEIVKPLRAYSRNRHYIYNREFRTSAKRMKFLGVLNDTGTTIDNGPAVEITQTSPDRLIVSPSDRDADGPVLDVE